MRPAKAGQSDFAAKFKNDSRTSGGCAVAAGATTDVDDPSSENPFCYVSHRKALALLVTY
jgi:hypothetical protein